MRSLFLTTTLIVSCGFTGSALASDPPQTPTTDTTEHAKANFTDKLKARLSEYDAFDSSAETGQPKTIDKDVRIYKFKSGDEIREKSKDIERMIVDSGVLSNLADMIADFAEDIEVEKGKNRLSFRFDGDTLGEVSRDDDDRVILKSKDKEMTVEKEHYIENGKTRTRIIIDMEGDGSDVNLDDVMSSE